MQPGKADMPAMREERTELYLQPTEDYRTPKEKACIDGYASSATGISEVESGPVPGVTLPQPPTPNGRISVYEDTRETHGNVGNQGIVDETSTRKGLSINESGTITCLDVLSGDVPNSELVSSGEGSVDPISYCADNWLERCLPFQDIPITWPPEDAYAQNLDINNPWTSTDTVTETMPDHDHYRDDGITSDALHKHQLTTTFDISDPKSDCYVILLSSLTQIESALASKPADHPAPIDFALRAESDLQTVKERIFACRSHSPSDTIIDGTYTVRPCLSSSRPVLLVLCLLAERVISLLEELFQRANITLQYFAGPPPEVLCASTRHGKRLMRSLVDCTSTCAFPEANRPLQIGRFGVSDEVKSRALRRILKGRMLGLLAMLGDMKRVAGIEGDEVLPSHTQGNALSVDSSGGFASGALGQSVGELYLRVESLLGRLDLTG
ncbi:hypothetical protein SCAR479_02877 [Seiridium cardinale]|uniref:Uncharacterized protein n=1 Tax=Seiridium cardinale TaxID=138064 RepID=A0ABR2Y2D5_9PEZI